MLVVAHNQYHQFIIYTAIAIIGPKFTHHHYLSISQQERANRTFAIRLFLGTGGMLWPLLLPSYQNNYIAKSTLRRVTLPYFSNCPYCMDNKKEYNSRSSTDSYPPSIIPNSTQVWGIGNQMLPCTGDIAHALSWHLPHNSHLIGGTVTGYLKCYWDLIKLL
jgi:hypothetical protein